MRYEEVIKNKVRLLRMEGFSLHQIQEMTSIPISTIAMWVATINLSEEQQNKLKKRAQEALQRGRVKAQEKKKEEAKAMQEILISKGKNEVRELNFRDTFLIGVALYWAEGFKNKHEHRLGFCNSDPNMIRFYLNWLEKSLKINKSDMVLRLTINDSYKDKTQEIQKYWSEITKIPLHQFTKPFYQHTLWRKQYTNKNYKGVLRIHVKNSLTLLLKMKGWIIGLTENLPG